nr:unnamed protein product [Callosobruchus analis]
MSIENLTGACETIAQFYNLPNIKIEVELWQQFWHNTSKPNSTDQTVVDILKEAKTFFPDTENFDRSSMHDVYGRATVLQPQETKNLAKKHYE